jgi:hypothetical protein
MYFAGSWNQKLQRQCAIYVILYIKRWINMVETVASASRQHDKGRDSI